MTDDTPRPRERIEREAVAWFTRMRGAPTAIEKRDFASWLRASPEHGRAYEGLGALWTDLNGPAARIGRETDDLGAPLQKIAQLRRGKRLAAAAKIAGCLAVLATSGWFWLENPNFVQDLGADQVTARAERRTVTLADGSTVLMDADSAIAIDLSDRERRIRLLRGTAFFTVTPSTVPFIVEAEGGEARVLGTEFDVARGPGEVTVTLARGRLEVARADAPPVLLAPGESVAYGKDGIGAVRAVDLEESTAWHQGRFVFSNARLADVLAQIGRYRDGRIILMGSSVGERRVTGNLALDDTDAALRALRATVGFRMVGLGGKITLIGP